MNQFLESEILIAVELLWNVSSCFVEEVSLWKTFFFTILNVHIWFLKFKLIHSIANFISVFEVGQNYFFEPQIVLFLNSKQIKEMHLKKFLCTVISENFLGPASFNKKILRNNKFDSF